MMTTAATNNIVWVNKTPHDVVILEPDDQGPIQGYVNGPLMNFKITKTIPPTESDPLRLVSAYKFPPSEVVVDGVKMSAYRPWTGTNLKIHDLPGKSTQLEYDPKNITAVYLIVSLPVGEFLLQPNGNPICTRFTHTEVVCPDTGPGSCVRDANGGIIGVLKMKSFGTLRYPYGMYY